MPYTPSKTRSCLLPALVCILGACTYHVDDVRQTDQSLVDRPGAMPGDRDFVFVLATDPATAREDRFDADELQARMDKHLIRFFKDNSYGAFIPAIRWIDIGEVDGFDCEDFATYSQMEDAVSKLDVQNLQPGASIHVALQCPAEYAIPKARSYRLQRLRMANGEQVETRISWSKGYNRSFASRLGILVFDCAHELMHGFWQSHSGAFASCEDPFRDDCELQEYGDTTDVMGGSFRLGHLGSGRKRWLNWIKQDEVSYVSDADLEEEQLLEIISLASDVRATPRSISIEVLTPPFDFLNLGQNYRYVVDLRAPEGLDAEDPVTGRRRNGYGVQVRLMADTQPHDTESLNAQDLESVDPVKVRRGDFFEQIDSLLVNRNRGPHNQALSTGEQFCDPINNVGVEIVGIETDRARIRVGRCQ